MKTGNPRHGSMQYWPRKRAKSIVARIRSWFTNNNTGFLGFAGYKAGMTHVIIRDNSKKGLDKNVPVTIIECPPLKTASLRFYKKTPYGFKIIGEILAQNLDKELSKKISKGKAKKKVEDFPDFDEVRMLVYTQPKLTGIGKKKPEIFELCLGGSKEDQLKLAQEKLGNKIRIDEVFQAGEQVDIHSVTKGKGYQGPVKRFGIGIRARKSEKTKRGPGSLGGWKSQGHVMYRIAYAGQTGYHTRTEYNKWIVKIDEDAGNIAVKGGIPHFGFVKNGYILLKGSVGGTKKRLIKMTKPRKITKKIPKEAPQIKYVSLESKQ